MNNKNELIQKLREKLKIPISDIRQINEEIIIYSNSQNIGKISINDYHFYDNSEFPEHIIQNLNWHLIYFNNKIAIEEEIELLFPDIDVFTTLGPFRKLYVKIKDTNDVEEIKSIVFCSFNGKWNIEKVT